MCRSVSFIDRVTDWDLAPLLIRAAAQMVQKVRRRRRRRRRLALLNATKPDIHKKPWLPKSGPTDSNNGGAAVGFVGSAQVQPRRILLEVHPAQNSWLPKSGGLMPPTAALPSALLDLRKSSHGEASWRFIHAQKILGSPSLGA